MKMKTTIGLWLATLWLLLALPFAAQAETELETGHQDTDLFMTNPNLDRGRPNIMFIIDNSANWTSDADGVTKYERVWSAFLSLIGVDPNDGRPVAEQVQDSMLSDFNIGMMITGKAGDGGGAYPRHGLKPMTDGNLVKFAEDILNWNESSIRGSNNTIGMNLHEAYLHFKGLKPYTGHKDPNADVEAFTNSSMSQYRPAVDEENPCGDNNHIIIISNGPPSSNEDVRTNSTASNNEMVKIFDDLGEDITNLVRDLDGDVVHSNPADEIARFFARKGIVTHTITVYPGTVKAQLDNIKLMASTAYQGNGEAHIVHKDGPSLEEIVGAIFSKIQAVNTVFAASSLPVSVNNRGTHLNEVYMAMFRPNEDAGPQWVGNLKLFQFGRDFDGNVVMVDAEGEPAQGSTGFLRTDSVSYWTSPSSYWEFDPRGVTDDPASDLPDGEIVEKGGVAQWLRANRESRTLFSSDGLMTLRPLNHASISEKIATDPGEAADIVDWLRGDNNVPVFGAGAVRPYIHGDVVHSSPTVINYNRTGDDSDIIVFYGANDGFLRAVKGGKVDGGSELWGYIPPEFLGEPKRQRDGSPPINTPSLPGSRSINNKPYLVDGNITSYVFDNNNDGSIVAADGDKAYIFATLRRGGRFLFAMDVSDPNDPKIKWVRGCYSDGSCDAGYAGIGETWSTPVVRRIGLDGDSVIALIMGKGYDSAVEDQHPASGTRTMGQGIMIINAENGDIIKQFGTDDGMSHSFPGAISALSINQPDRYTNRLYAGDTGGNVWRVDLLNDNRNDWKVVKIAELSGTGVNERKFLHVPVVVAGSDSNGPYHAILIGSGDREKPFEFDILNHFYMLKDRNVTGSGKGHEVIQLGSPADGDVGPHNFLYNATDNLIQDGDADTRNEESIKLDNAAGWYIELLGGEKVVGSAEARAGSVFFATNQTSAMAVTDPNDPLFCASDLGIARTYVMSSADATATVDRDGSGDKTKDDRTKTSGEHAGYLPAPTYALVCLDKDCNDIVEVINMGAETLSLGDVELGTRQRDFWFKEVD